MNVDAINDLLGITEGYQLPDKLLQVLEANEHGAICELLTAQGLEHDILRDYFQNEHSDRDKFKQDYTPDCLCSLVAQMTTIDYLDHKPNSIADICAGTGALSIALWKLYPDAFFHCEEVASRVIPFCLLNLCARNITGEVVRKDILTGEVFGVWKLSKGTRYSVVTKCNTYEPDFYDVVVSNPPYSIKWKPLYFDICAEFEFMPNIADYFFLIYCYSLGMKAHLILPHGVLFRGQKDGYCRKRILELNWFASIVGAPDKMFLNTSIPVAVLTLEHDKPENGVLIIDASKGFQKVGKQNVMMPEHISKIVDAVRARSYVDKFANVASFEEIKKNDYNLNIPRYVDTFEREPAPDLVETLQELIEVNRDIGANNKEILGFIEQLVCTTEGGGAMEQVKALAREALK
nr:MAG TPA: N-6 DNA Methylase [Caudoviricetes sp.]